MSDVVDFLLMRIAEDEAAARAEDADYAHTSLLPTYDSDHQVRWSTERVLAECEAKRVLVEDVHVWLVSDFEPYPLCLACRTEFPCRTLRLLAAPYRDHADFDQSWAVPE